MLDPMFLCYVNENEYVYTRANENIKMGRTAVLITFQKSSANFPDTIIDNRSSITSALCVKQVKLKMESEMNFCF